jgi:hypothetical protein
MTVQPIASQWQWRTVLKGAVLGMLAANHSRLSQAHGALSWQRLWYGHIARALMATTDLPLLVVNRYTACRS